MPDYIKRVRKGGREYLYFWPGGELRSLGARPSRLPPDLALAREEAKRLVENVWLRRAPTFRKHVLQLLKNARARCKRSGVALSLSEGDLMEMLERQGYRCAVSGIAFDLTDPGSARRVFRKPYRPSLDRIACKGPYSKQNVRLVCVAVNVALNEWGEPVLYKIAASIAAKE